MISENYRNAIVQLHSNPEYGNSDYFYPFINQVIKKGSISSILDYGCGKGAMMSKILENHPYIKVDGYDPCVNKFSVDIKEKYDCLISTNVLENVENIFINDVLKHIDGIFNTRAFFIISIFNQSFYDSHPEATEENFYFHTVEKNSAWWKNKISSVITDCHIHTDEYDFGHPDKIAALIELVRA